MKFVGQGKEYATISGAINASNGNGEVITVSSGIYNEQVVINKYINLRADTFVPEEGTVAIAGCTPLFYELFEDGNLDGWSFSGDANWGVTASGGGYNSTFAAKSGVITHDQTSCMYRTINLTENGILEFYWKVSSEAGYDKLKFYINDVLQDDISGVVDWAKKVYYLSAGGKTLKWCYGKDGSGETGSDCGWVDDIKMSEPLDKVVKIIYSPAACEDIYIEGFKISKSLCNDLAPVYFFETNNKLGIYLNKCSILSDAHVGGVIDVCNKDLNKLFIKNCCIKGVSSAHLANVGWSNINEKGIINTELEVNYSCCTCSGNLDMLDVVTVPTVGYGPAYGNYYDNGYFSGYVFEQNNPISRKLYLYDRLTGDLVTTTTSSGDGYYYMETSSSGSHNIVCLDDDLGVKYNDIIKGNIFPTTMSG